MHAKQAVQSALRVLVVDDSQDGADSTAVILRLWGHEATVAYSAAAALTVAPTFQPHVMLLDIAMPSMDGLKLAGKFRDEPSLSGAALIALTGFADAAMCRRAIDAGFDHVLVKPVDLEELQALLSGIATLRQRMEETRAQTQAGRTDTHELVQRAVSLVGTTKEQTLRAAHLVGRAPQETNEN